MNIIENARWRIVVRSEWRFAIAILAGAIFLGYATTVFEPLFVRKPAILAVLPLLMVGAGLLVVSLEWSVLALMLLRAGADPFLASTATGGLSAGAALNVGMILIALALFVRRPALVPKHVYMTWIPFLVITLIACARSPEKPEALKIWAAWLTIASVHFIAVYLVARGRRVHDLLRLIAIGSLLPTVVGVVAALIRRPAAVETGPDAAGGFRLAGAFGHANIFGFYLILMIALVLYFWATDRADKKTYTWLWPCYLIVLVALLGLTKTRSAWGAAVPIMLFYGWKFDRRFLVALCIVGPLLALGIPQIRDRLIDLQSGNTYSTFAQLNSFAWRKLLWTDAFGFMHPQDWIWGNGYRAFERDSLRFFPLNVSGGIEWSAHNVYVQLLYDTGIIGFFAYVWAYLSQLRCVVWQWRSDPRTSYLIGASIGGCLIVGYSDNMLSYLVYNWYLWFVVGVVSAPAVLRIAAERAETRRLLQFTPAWR